jgi:hypothetical protein
MRYLPGLFNILPLYVYLLILGPLFVILLRKKTWIAVSLSFILWLVVQFQSWLALPDPFAGYDFHPLAFQMLFVFGIVLGWYRPDIRDRRLFAFAALLVIVSAVKSWLLPQLAGWGVAVPDALLTTLPLTARRTLAPLRLLHFSALAYVVAYLSTQLQTFLERPKLLSRWLHTVFTLPGQHSLDVFSFGVVYTYVSVGLLRRTTDHWFPVLTAILAGWLLSIGFARLIYRIKTTLKK